MARMKDFKDKLTVLKDKFKTDKSDDQFLKLIYDTNLSINNITAMKEFCSEIKRIGSHGIATYSVSNDDRKMNKKSLNYLSQLFSETSSKFHDSDPMRGSLNYSAIVLAKINGITMEFEKNIQQQVIGPLLDIEVQCGEIQELRKKLHDIGRDVLNLNEKLVKIMEQTNNDDQKVHALRDQIEEMEMEFDNVSDLYLQRILQFEASNFENASTIHEMIIARAEYHDKCSKELLKIIPESHQFMEARRIHVSFGYALENHLREIKKCIAYPIEKCVTALSNIDELREEGLFRVSGGKSKSNLLCSVLNLMKFDQLSCKWSPHVVADALKRYLREMPVSLLGKVNYSDWESCNEKFKSGKKQDAYWQIKELINKIPKSYYNNLEYLLRFLNKVIQEKSFNLMNVQNICTVFTPNLFKHSNNDAGSVGMNMEINSTCNFILETLLNETNFFFPHSNRLPDSGKMPSNKITSNDTSKDKDLILFRSYSSNSSDKNKESQASDVKSQRRRQRFLDSNLFFSDGSPPSQISSQSSLQSIISESDSLEISIPITPPRRNKKL